MKAFGWLGVVVMGGALGACASSEGDACEGTLVSDGSVCVVSQPITETGFDCPPTLPFEYGGEFDDGGDWALCSSRGDLDQEAIENAMREAGFGSEGGPEFPTEPEPEPEEPCVDDDHDGICNETCTRPDPATGECTEPEPEPEPEEPCIDEDRDGICNEPCVRPDPSTGECTDPEPEPEPEPEPTVYMCEDNDMDGTCLGMDLVDDDADLLAAGLVEADGVFYVLSCTPSGECLGVELCMYAPLDPWEGQTYVPEVVALAREHCADYDGDYLTDDGQISDYAEKCVTANGEELCWMYPVTCQEGGHIAMCEEAQPCLDENSNRVCDDEE